MSPDDRPLWAAQGYSERVAEATCRGIAEIYGFAYVPPPGAVVVTPLDLDRQVFIPPYGLAVVADDGVPRT